MIDKDLLNTINRVANDAEREAGFLTQAACLDFILRQRLMNAGNTFSRLAMEMYVAAGGVEKE